MLPADLHALVRRLHIAVRRKVRSGLAGRYRSLFKGSGLTFEEVREYQPGDDVRSIDWNVTARLNAPFVKRYSEERQRVILLAVDVSASVDCGSAPGGKRRAFAEMAALLALGAVENQDRVGLLLFAGGIVRYLPPGTVRLTVPRVLREILQAKPNLSGTDLHGALDFVNRLKVRRAVVVLMSDFRARDYANALRRTARRHELLAVRVTDPREEALPNSGLLRLRDAETGAVLLVDTASAELRRLYALRSEERRAEFRQTMRGARADSLEVSTAGGHLEALIRHFERRTARRGAPR